MAWFDYLGGLAGAAGQIGSEMQSAKDRQLAQKRQAEQDARAAAEETRRATEFDAKRAEDLYSQYEVGQELDANSPEAKLLQTYYKRGLAKGTTPGTLSIRETPERKQTREQQALTARKFAAETAKMGEEEAINRRAQDLAAQLAANPTQSVQILSGIPRALRAQIAASMGVKPEDLLTPAEQLADAKRTPGYLAQALQSGTQMSIAQLPQRGRQGIDPQSVEAAKALVANITNRLTNDFTLTKQARAQLQAQLDQANQVLAQLGGISPEAAMPQTLKVGKYTVNY